MTQLTKCLCTNCQHLFMPWSFEVGISSAIPLGEAVALDGVHPWFSQTEDYESLRASIQKLAKCWRLRFSKSVLKCYSHFIMPRTTTEKKTLVKKLPIKSRPNTKAC